MKKNKVFCFDIDGVIASITANAEYNAATPIKKNIKIINRLFDNGNEIILFTARGSTTGIDWRQTTENQMKEWGVKHNDLKFGKPSADYYIDDKMLSLKDLSLIYN
jgi:ribonucleotide monophosphatase NagD (HAD superfamily)